jgi:hypothetical protein
VYYYSDTRTCPHCGNQITTTLSNILEAITLKNIAIVLGLTFAIILASGKWHDLCQIGMLVVIIVFVWDYAHAVTHVEGRVEREKAKEAEKKKDA